MSASTFPASYPASFPSAFPAVGVAFDPIVRLPSRMQGQALNVLSHAIEYLIDSRAFEGVDVETAAVEILARLNREVFAGCTPVLSFRQRMTRRLESLLG